MENAVALNKIVFPVSQGEYWDTGTGSTPRTIVDSTKAAVSDCKTHKRSWLTGHLADFQDIPVCGNMTSLAVVAENQ